MSITQDQFEQLTEMGISLWQRRRSEKKVDTVTSQPVSFLTIDIAALSTQQLFIDILLAAGLTIGEISQQGNYLDLGLFNWYFTPSESEVKIYWHEQQLFTPAIDKIAQSPKLKKQLWHLLGTQAQ